jgi:oligopeptide/dipeptide ABC transporter ATP-binding protein
MSSLSAEHVLEVEGLVKHFHVGAQLLGGGGTVHAVDGVSLRIGPGEMLGLVGESGSGKSTVGNCVARLVEPTAGTVRIRGVDVTHLSRRSMRPLRREVHMVFQDPYSSLNPRMTCGQIVGEPIRLHRLARGRELEARVVTLFEQVGLRVELRHRYPHELSGGQRQRVGLARALSVSPSLLIADEPVSALDVSVQAAILNLLRDLQRDLGFSCLFITHDLATVEYLCDRVAVMYLGKIVEEASTEELFAAPKHPYTQALLSAAVVPDPDVQRARTRVVLEGDVPSPLAPPSGCRFRTRCPLAAESAPQSEEEEPELRVVAPGHRVACHLVTAGEAPELIDLAAEPA